MAYDYWWEIIKDVPSFFDRLRTRESNKRAVPSSVASPICHEGQSERNFLIFAFSSRLFVFSPNFSWFFPDFPDYFPIFLDFFPIFSIFGNLFAVWDGNLRPLPPQWLRHWLYRNSDHSEQYYTWIMDHLNVQH